jgi:hypothetical protein
MSEGRRIDVTPNHDGKNQLYDVIDTPNGKKYIYIDMEAFEPWGRHRGRGPSVHERDGSVNTLTLIPIK